MAGERPALEGCCDARELLGGRSGSLDVPGGHLISTCAASSGARRRSELGGNSFDGTFEGRSRASRINAVASGTSPWARRTSARPGYGSHPAWCAATNASSGAPDVSGAQASPTELRERPSELPSQIGPQLLTGAERFLLSLEAGPPQPEDLGPVHAAASVDAPHGLAVAPSFHRLRPLLGDVVLRQCLERAHHLAVRRPPWRAD